MADPADGDREKPDWWARNERLREEMGLPPYEPPRFEDGVPTFEITGELETDHGCTIRFRGVNTAYPDDLRVTVDGEQVATIGRHRDADANTVYEMTSEEFRELVTAAAAER